MEEKSKEEPKEKRDIHPKKKSSFLGHFFFCWQIPLLFKGLRKDFTEDLLWQPLEEHGSKQLGDELEKLCEYEENFCKNPSLWRALIKMFGWNLIVCGITLYLIDICVTMLQPFFLEKLLTYYESNRMSITKREALLYGFGIPLSFLIRTLVLHNSRLEMTVIGMKVRIACCSLLYRKSLKIKKADFQRVTTGQMINLMSNDVNRFDNVFVFMYCLWTAPLEVLIFGYYLDFAAGHAATVGLAVVLFCLLVQIVFTHYIGIQRRIIALKSDHRIRIMNDIICCIKIIKMYSWEKPFGNIIATARKSESREIKKANYLRLLIQNFSLVCFKCSIFFCILTLVLSGQPLTPQYIYTVTLLYDRLKLSVMILLPTANFNFREADVSVRRIEAFLLFDKKSENIVTKARRSSNCCILRSSTNFQNDLLGILANKVTVKWDPSLPNTTLTDITFSVLPKEVVGVTGSAGGGKSTLLQVILKELSPIKGSLHVGGTITYVAQEPWIFSASIRQNIIFTAKFDEAKYSKVIRVCAMEHDLSLFPYGDNTLVGDRGVMLSGGQKARISLARAVYRDADIYLLDDPLSAVDAAVANQIFHECILSYLKNKCVILVTHQVQFLKRVDRVYHLEEGKMIFSNTYKELDAINENNERIEEEEVQFATYKIPTAIKEHRNTGNTVLKTYKTYCLAGGSWLSILLKFLLTLVTTTVLKIGTDYFLAFWVNSKQSLDNVSKEMGYLCIYGSLVISLSLFCGVATSIYTKFTTDASTNFHDRMLMRVLYGTMTFFNNHSSGRILNRFAKDLGAVDEAIPQMLLDSINAFLFFLCTGLIISIINYLMIIPTAMLMVLFYGYSRLFQPTIRNIKRTEGITRSPVFSHLSATLQGLTTIKAFNAQEVLREEFDNYQDVHTTYFYLSTAIFGTLGFWVDITSVIYVGTIVSSFFLLEDYVYVGDVGFVLTQSLILIVSLQHGMKTWSTLETQMTSVERVSEYGEVPTDTDDGKNIPSDTWPNKGNIQYHQVTMRYFPESPLVLKQVSFNIKSGEKIGIVGRTGAGKTSLISALFRLFHFEGKITIDEVDTKTIPLNLLRSKISTIPQEPVVFYGTLRKNLDPFDEFTDSALWQALEEVELKKEFANLPLGLDTVVSEGGSNFSVGQRQLLCLVRIMLKRTKIIVLDEATANVDLNTDRLIQATIRRKFKECTVLTIAHRLNTIMDADRILIMDSGRVVGFDRPEQMLDDFDGILSNYFKNETKSKM